MVLAHYHVSRWRLLKEIINELIVSLGKMANESTVLFKPGCGSRLKPTIEPFFQSQPWLIRGVNAINFHFLKKPETHLKRRQTQQNAKCNYVNSDSLVHLQNRK